MQISLQLRVFETPEEGRRKHQPKHFEYNTKDEDNSQKTLNDDTLNSVLIPKYKIFGRDSIYIYIYIYIYVFFRMT